MRTFLLIAILAVAAIPTQLHAEGFGRQNGVYGTLDYLNWETVRSTTPYAGTLGTAPATIGGMTVSSGSYSSELIDTPFDHDSGFRMSLGYMHEGWDLGFRFTAFDNSGRDNIGDPNVDTDDVIANRLDRQLADNNNATLNGLFQAGIVDFGEQTLSVTYDTFDFEVAKWFEAGRPECMVRVMGGLRYGQVGQDSSILYVNRELSGGLPDVDTALINEEINTDAFGLRAGVDAHYYLGWNTHVFAKSAFSLLLADTTATRSDLYSNASLSTVGYRTTSQDFFSVVPVTEIALGTRFEYCGAYLSCGYELTHWFNMIQGVDVTLQDDVIANAQAYRFDRGELGLQGIFLEAGYIY